MYSVYNRYTGLNVEQDILCLITFVHPKTIYNDNIRSMLNLETVELFFTRVIYTRGVFIIKHKYVNQGIKY